MSHHLPSTLRSLATEVEDQATRHAGHIRHAVAPAMAAAPAVIDVLSTLQHEVNGQLPAHVREAAVEVGRGAGRQVGRAGRRLGHEARQLGGAVVPALGAVPVVADQLSKGQPGRWERTLSGLTAMGAVVSGVETYLDRDRDGDHVGSPMMWIPVALAPVAAVAGFAALFSRRAAKTALPLISAIVIVNNLHGQYQQLRGAGRRDAPVAPATAD